MSDNPLISVAGLKKSRGWTLALIRRFLGEPDKLARNPHYRSAAPTRLYSRARVEAAEADPEFAVAQSQARRRVLAGKATAEAKRAALVAEIAAMHVEVRRVPLDTLRRAAIGHYERLHEREERVSRDAPSGFLERIQVNYIRHVLTRYDEDLDAVAGRIGVAEARRAIRRKVFDAIAEAYPEFADEAHSQRRAREPEPP